MLWIEDVVGIVKNVSSTMSIRRKSNNETVPKRDITIADERSVVSTSFTVLCILYLVILTNKITLLDTAARRQLLCLCGAILQPT